MDWHKKLLSIKNPQLQENEDILMAALSVFIQDPSMDWIKDSKRANNKMLPQERIKIVKEKLNCTDPTKILVKLLRGYYKHERLIPQLENLVSDHMIQQTKSAVNSEDVVRCLINLASDGAILARSYTGYRPYF